MAEILVFSEKDELACELVSKAREFGAALNMQVAAALLGGGKTAQAARCFAYGADKVYVGEHPALADFHAETFAEALYQIAQKNDARVLLLASTKRGKELAPRIAQKLGAGCITDATAIELQGENLRVSRYALGGNTVAQQIIQTPHKVIAVMPGTFELGAQATGQGQIVPVDLDLSGPRARIVERRKKAAEAVNLEEAEVLVCVGRGLGKREDLTIIEALAQALGAEIGCTKTLCTDYQWLSEDRLVGLSGKKTAPRLVLSVGISGQIQYAVGIRDARIAVAINQDAQAPIFALSDYGVVGDLYEIVPSLTKRLQPG